MTTDSTIQPSWKDSIFRQREELASMLHEPVALLAKECVSNWGDREQLDAILQEGFSGIPYCAYLYIVGTDGIQITDNVGIKGLSTEHYRRDRSARPYMKEAMPAWGFLLSDAYISLYAHRPSLTALQVIKSDDDTLLGYLGADFDLRKLPVTSTLYQEPGNWRQVKGDPAIRSTLFLQSRTESPMDRNIQNALSILEELLTERGIFQCQIHFSSSQATIWTIDDPLRYRILDQDALIDPDICLVYPARPYPSDAIIPKTAINKILQEMQTLRLVDTTIYLRTASINIYNGMLSLTFSCDGSHYMRYDEFFSKGPAFWSGSAA